MNILIITSVFPPEPVVSAQTTRDLVESLINDGHEVTVLVPNPSRPAGFKFHTSYYENRDGYYRTLVPKAKVIILKSIASPKSTLTGRFLESWSFGRHASRFIEDNKNVTFDKVYVSSWPIFSQFLIARTCNRNNIPYIMHVQDIYPESLTNKLNIVLRGFVKAFLMPFEQYHVKNASTVIVISENMRSHLIKTRRILEEKVFLVYNWQNEEEFLFENVQKSNKSKFIFSYLGNIGPVAGVETLINAFGLADLRNCQLVIAGSGSQKENCKKLAASYPIADIVFKSVPAGAVAKIQNEADVLLLPVIKGGALSSIPSKLPAYMLSSKPVLASLDRESDSAKAILAAKCGWVGDPENVRWLSNMMATISKTDPQELEILGKNGNLYCMENFSKSNNLDKLRLLFQEETNSLTVRNLAVADCFDIAALHTDAFKNFFLTSLGESFLRVFYEAILSNEYGLGIGVYAGIKLIGFAVGTRNNTGFYKSLILKKGFRMILGALPRLILSPLQLKRLLQTFSLSNKNDEEFYNKAVLLSICVSPNRTTKGLGKKLLNKFENELIRYNNKDLILTTDCDNNEYVNQFYIGNHYIKVKSFLQGKRRMNLYYKKLKK